MFCVWEKNNPKSKPITINGKYYPTRTEAMKSLGISRKVFERKIKNNKNKPITITLELRECTKGKYAYQAKAVIANWKFYHTITKAAKKLNICNATVTHKIKQHKPEYYWV